jgi:hypothetical protein
MQGKEAERFIHGSGTEKSLAKISNFSNKGWPCFVSFS